MDCSLDNSIVLMLNFLILIIVLWFVNVLVLSKYTVQCSDYLQLPFKWSRKTLLMWLTFIENDLKNGAKRKQSMHLGKAIRDFLELVLQLFCNLK